MDRNKELKVHRLRLPGRSLCSIRSNRKWCKRRGSSLQCQNCFFVYPIIDCNLKNLLFSYGGTAIVFKATNRNYTIIFITYNESSVIPKFPTCSAVFTGIRLPPYLSKLVNMVYPGKRLLTSASLISAIAVRVGRLSLLLRL